jgi:hypothetical protein
MKPADLTEVLDKMHYSYSIDPLRGLPAFPLYASLGREPDSTADAERPVRLPVLGRDGLLRLFDVANPTSKLS